MLIRQQQIARRLMAREKYLQDAQSNSQVEADEKSKDRTPYIHDLERYMEQEDLYTTISDCSHYVNDGGHDIDSLMTTIDQSTLAAEQTDAYQQLSRECMLYARGLSHEGVAHLYALFAGAGQHIETLLLDSSGVTNLSFIKTRTCSIGRIIFTDCAQLVNFICPDVRFTKLALMQTLRCNGLENLGGVGDIVAYNDGFTFRLCGNTALDNFIGVDSQHFLVNNVVTEQDTNIRLRQSGSELCLRHFSQDGLSHAIMSFISRRQNAAKKYREQVHIRRLVLEKCINIAFIIDLKELQQLVIDNPYYLDKNREHLSFAINNVQLEYIQFRNCVYCLDIQFHHYERLQAIKFFNCLPLNQDYLYNILRQTKQLRHLAIIDTKILVTDANFLEKQVFLMTLVMVNNDYAPNDLDQLVSQLIQLRQLKYLAIMHNPINEQFDVDHIAQLLGRHPNQKLELQLCNKGISPEVRFDELVHLTMNISIVMNKNFDAETGREFNYKELDDIASVINESSTAHKQ